MLHKYLSVTYGFSASSRSEWVLLFRRFDGCSSCHAGSPALFFLTHPLFRGASYFFLVYATAGGLLLVRYRWRVLSRVSRPHFLTQIPFSLIPDAMPAPGDGTSLRTHVSSLVFLPDGTIAGWGLPHLFPVDVSFQLTR